MRSAYWDDFAATICCSVAVSEVNDLGKATTFIRFRDARLVDSELLIAPHQGQNSFEAPPPRGHESDETSKTHIQLIGSVIH